MSESIRAALKSGSPGQTIALLLASAFFLAAGIGHFTHADFFVAIMPPICRPISSWFISAEYSRSSEASAFCCRRFVVRRASA